MIFINKKVENKLENEMKDPELNFENYPNKFLNDLQCSVRNDEEYAKYKGYLD